MQGNPGVNRLVRAQLGLVREHATREEWLSLGTITDDLGLQVDHFRVPFPQGAYYVLEYLRAPDPIATASDGSTVPRPEILAPLEPGDRVLVAFVNGGADPVVIGRVRRVA